MTKITKDKPLVLIERHPYQYEQIKEFIEELELPYVYGCLHLWTGKPGQYKPFPDKVFLPDHSEIAIKDIPEFQYLIHTARPTKQALNLAKNSIIGKVVCMSHSILGNGVDLGWVTPTNKKALGLMPSCWVKMEPYQNHKKPKQAYFIHVKTYPMMAHITGTPIKASIDEKAIGVVMNWANKLFDMEWIVRKIQHTIGGNVYIKPHPLDKRSLSTIKRDHPDWNILDKLSDPYEFTDRCKYIIGSQSSLMAEAIVRNNYYNRGQSFWKLPGDDGALNRVPQAKSFDPDFNPEITTYNEMMLGHNDTIDYCKRLFLEEIISVII